MWDSKYTTNINTEMNYWPAEVANLSEWREPLFRMIRDLTDQGAGVARELYGARGWAFHQNTDLWRVAAPMDGPNWGGFATGGGWLATHLWEHYRFTGDKAFLTEYYPVLRGSAEFFLDFLVPHPKYGWLVTNPSTSPENFPLAPGNDRFFDEVTGSMSNGHGAGARVRPSTRRSSRDVFTAVCEAPPCSAWTRTPRCGCSRCDGEAGADARRPTRRPAGVDRGLGPARTEPPAHLAISTACSRATKSRPGGRPTSRRPAASCSNSGVSSGNGWSSAWKAGELGAPARRRTRRWSTWCTR